MSTFRRGYDKIIGQAFIAVYYFMQACPGESMMASFSTGEYSTHHEKCSMAGAPISNVGVAAAVIRSR